MSTMNSIGSNKPIEVAFGGTGAATLTAHGVLLGEGTSAVTATTAGTNGQLLCASTGADPAFTSLTSTGSTLSYTTGAHTLNIDINAPLTVANGGTGKTTLTAHSVQVGNGTTATTQLGVGSNGQVL